MAESDKIDEFRAEYRFLSNFYMFPGISGMTSVEHHYQAAKTKSPEQAAWIKASPSPGEAKRRGKFVVLDRNWGQRKVRVMRMLLRWKFQNAELRQKLLDTYPAELVEGNTWGDTFWGVCNGIGENHLGKLLMKIREELLAEHNLLAQKPLNTNLNTAWNSVDDPAQ